MIKHTENIDLLEKRGELNVNKKYILDAIEHLSNEKLKLSTQHLIDSLKSINKDNYINDIIEMIHANYEEYKNELSQKYRKKNQVETLKAIAEELSKVDMWQLYEIYSSEIEEVVKLLKDM